MNDQNHLYTWYGDNTGKGKMTCTCGWSGQYDDKDEAIATHKAHRLIQTNEVLA
jgi:hypothetical protein